MHAYVPVACTAVPQLTDVQIGQEVGALVVEELGRLRSRQRTRNQRDDMQVD